MSGSKTKGNEDQAALPPEVAPARVRLPDTRHSLTHKFSISGHEGYVTAGCYEDGRLGEVFIKMSKQGSTVSGLTDAVAVLMSLCLQYGVPVEKLVEKLSHTRFEPLGYTTNPAIPEASSVVDYIARWIEEIFIETEVVSRPTAATPESEYRPIE